MDSKLQIISRILFLLHSKKRKEKTFWNQQVQRKPEIVISQPGAA